MNYFFIPGRKFELALAELKNVFVKYDVVYKLLDSNGDLILIETKDSEDKLLKIFRKLGGYKKFGIIINDPYEYIDAYSKDDNKKVRFSVSFYDNLSSRELFKLGMSIKSYLKSKGISSRFVSNKNDLVTSAPLIVKNRVLDKGFELNLFSKQKGLWGITLDLQDYQGFSYRDFYRPMSNKLKGMLPPKLARIMINLSDLKENQTLWDPFCGSGTILQEAIILGFAVIGSDSDDISIEESKTNLNWIVEKYNLDKSFFRVFKQDATEKLLEKIEYDAIVTEPYLGPVLKNEPSKDEACKIISNLENLYSKFFNNMSLICKPNTIIVFIVPDIKTDEGWMSIVKKFWNDKKFVKIDMGENLHWDRPNSIIRRQIKIFRKI